MTDIGKPLECPHCGLGEAELCTDDSRAMTHFVYCDGCGARTGYSFTKEAAIAAWNRRTPAANSNPLLVEALTTAREFLGGIYDPEDDVLHELRNRIDALLAQDTRSWSKDEALVDALAQEIRRVDGNHQLGAGALAEALMPFLSRPSGADAKRWLVEETLPSGSIRWQAFEYELDANLRAGSSEHPCVVTALYAAPPLPEPVAVAPDLEPVAWHCFGSGQGWIEDKLTRDAETAEDYSKRPAQWKVEPLIRLSDHADALATLSANLDAITRERPAHKLVCHRTKTHTKDRPAINQAKRREAKHNGVKRAKGGFPKPAKEQKPAKFDMTIRRSLFTGERT